MLYLLGALALFLGEEGLKGWIEKRLSLKQEKPLLNNRLILTKHHNYGFAHNRRSDKRSQVLGVSVLGLFLIAGNALLAFFSGMSHGIKAGMMLLLAGGLSNAYDRIRRAYVTDYFIINIGRLKRTIFNLADMMLLLGAAICVVASLFSQQEEECL